MLIHSLHRTSGLFKVPREGALREAHGAERRPLRPEARGWGWLDQTAETSG